MECKNHPSVPAVERCVGCAELFCEYCLVEVLGQKYCGSCKVMAVKEPAQTYGEGLVPCEAAGKALTYSIVGIFCFGMIFGPMAIAKAIEARKEIKEDPSMSGLGKANVGLLLGIAVILFWIIGMITKYKNR
jgi:hypothetical protein